MWRDPSLVRAKMAERDAAVAHRRRRLSDTLPPIAPREPRGPGIRRRVARFAFAVAVALDATLRTR